MKLPEGWALLRTTDGWEVGEMTDECYECGSSFRFWGSGSTPAKAIAAALAAKEGQEEREKVWRQDYERRKAAGELTPLELVNEHVPTIWSQATSDAIQMGSVISARMIGDFER